MSYDCGFIREDNLFRYRAAAIIVEGDYVLLAGNERVDYYYSVGGAVNLNETAKEAVEREVYEETGVKYTAERLAVIHENFFHDDGVHQTINNFHELSFYYIMKPRGTREINPTGYAVGVPETMHWIKISDLPALNAYPKFLYDFLMNPQKEIVHIISK